MTYLAALDAQYQAWLAETKASDRFLSQAERRLLETTAMDEGALSRPDFYSFAEFDAWLRQEPIADSFTDVEPEGFDPLDVFASAGRDFHAGPVYIPSSDLAWYRVQDAARSALAALDEHGRRLLHREYHLRLGRKPLSPQERAEQERKEQKRFLAQQDEFIVLRRP